MLRKIERGEGRRCLCILRLIICDIKFYNDSRISAKERRKECGCESFFFFLVFLVFSSFVFSICRKAVLSACFFPLPPFFLDSCYYFLQNDIIVIWQWRINDLSDLWGEISKQTKSDWHTFIYIYEVLVVGIRLYCKGKTLHLLSISDRTHITCT